MIYEWKPRFNKNADPQKVGEEIDSLGKEITPKMVIKKAKSKKTELHKCFEWDLERAAEEYHLRQARDVMCFLIRVEEKPADNGGPTKIEVRAFENIIIKSNHVYVSSETIVKDDDLYALLLEGITTGIAQLDNKLRNYEYLHKDKGPPLKPVREKLAEAKELVEQL
jgi:hypothetical protein